MNLAMNPFFQAVMKKHKIGVFTVSLVDDDGHVTICLNEKVMKAFHDDLQKEFPELNFFFEKLPEEIISSVDDVEPVDDDHSVAHPPHYNSGKIEVIEFIEDQGFGPGFTRGNAIKYIARAGKKDREKEIEDLKKAHWYLEREIERLTAIKEGRDPVRPNDMRNTSGNTAIKVFRDDHQTMVGGAEHHITAISGKWGKVTDSEGNEIECFVPSNHAYTANIDRSIAYVARKC